MTITRRNRIIGLLLLVNIGVSIFLGYWIWQYWPVLDKVATLSIFSSTLLSLGMFSLTLGFFYKTNAPELTLLVGYALGLLMQAARFFLVIPGYINTQTLQAYGLSLAVFGYFLILASLLFIALYEVNTLSIYIEDLLIYFAVILYIFIAVQPVDTTEVLAGYFYSFIDESSITLLRIILTSIILILTAILLFNKDESYKPYFALAVLVLNFGLRSFWLAENLFSTLLGFILQIIGLVILFVLIRRRYLWFRWT